MRRIILCLAFIMAMLGLHIPAAAVSVTERGEEMLDTYSLEQSVPSEAAGILGEISVSSADGGGMLDRIVKAGINALTDARGEAMKGGVRLMMASFFAGLVSALPAGRGKAMRSAANLAGVCAVMAVGISSAGPFIGLAADTLEDLAAFGASLLPVMTAAEAAAGAVTASAAKYAVSTLYMSVVLSVGKKLVLPLIYAYIAASGAAAAFGGVPKGAPALIKKAVTVTLTLTALSFTAYILITGLVTSTADAASIRAAKTAISTVLPVVGSMVADAADTVVSGMAVLKNGVGVFGAAVILAACVGPFVKLGLNILIYKAVAMLAEPFGGPTAAVISAVGDALSMAAAMAGTGAVVLFVSVVSAMGAVSG